MPDEHANALAIAALAERVDGNDRRYTEQRAADKTALDAAVETQGKRLDGMNKFREALTDQAATFATRETVDELKARMDRQEGRGTGLNNGWGYIVGGIGVVIAVVMLVLQMRANP